MKNLYKVLFSILVSVVVIFSMVSCKNPKGNDNVDKALKAGDLMTSDSGIILAWIPAGTFTMGSNDPQDYNAQPAHQVTLSQGFWMGIYTVTQGLWKSVMETTIQQQEELTGNGLRGVGDNHPMYYVSWYEAIEFCNRLSIIEGLSPAYRINDNTDPDEWPTKGAAQVGTKQPNDWVLFDMHGNVWEWCWDWWEDYTDEEKTDPTGPGSPSSETSRVMRGGSWGGTPRNARSANRGGNIPSNPSYMLGFRLIRPGS